VLFWPYAFLVVVISSITQRCLSGVSVTGDVLWPRPGTLPLSLFGEGSLDGNLQFPVNRTGGMFTAKMGMANHFVQQVLTRAA